MKRTRSFPWLATAVSLGAALAPASSRAGRSDSVERAMKAQELIYGLDLDDARKVLASADAEDPNVAMERARLALYEEDCEGALAFLARPELQHNEEGAVLTDVARGCVRVTAATVVEKDAARAIEVRFQDEHDRALAPLLMETVVLARDALTRDLGVTWPKPTRITVVRDLLSLSAMTGLPYESAKTTGTVAVAKWGRVTLLSPRASPHGYAWRDTVTHELTHLAVTRATADRAPLWLQEGVAKRQEVRWREPGPFDDRPSSDAMAKRGIELKIDLPLDRMGPSIAMLPSADAAMVAFAEVTSFVGYYADTAGERALPRLLAALRERKSPDEALAAVSGTDLKGWDGRWRGALLSRTTPPLSSLHGLGATPPDTRELRDRVRLAELLLGRGHARAASQELEPLKNPVLQEDPSLRALRARVHLATDRVPDAHASLGDPKDVVSSFGPWWSIRGVMAAHKGDEPTRAQAFSEAVAADPLDEEAACETVRLPQGTGGSLAGASSPAHPALCDAARSRREPLVGQD